MARPAPDLIVFRRDDLSQPVGVMRELAPAAGWLRLQPGIDPDDAPRHAGSGLFSGRGPVVPVCGWVPGERTRRGIEHVALGIEHAAGPQAAGLLAERDVGVPGRWVVLQDDPRRGLVIAVPPADDHGTVLRWLLDAAGALTKVPLTGEWRAFVYRR